MRDRRRRAAAFVVLLCMAMVLSATTAAFAWTPKPVKQDPLVFMPGSQPGNVQGMDNATRCENCHSGYNPAVEPGSNWRGSMMAQSARDPMWLACLTVAAQDSIWAVGNPNATDICIRCHAPGGWLGGRSDPTNTSMLAGTDFEGVECDFCHRKQDPFATNGQPDVPADSGAALTMAQAAYTQTITDMSRLTLFNGSPFFNTVTMLPTFYGPFSAYSEQGAGQYFIAQSSGPKWGPRSQTVARHQIQYSRFHRSREFCHACHDVSNPVLQNALSGLPGAQGTESKAAASYFHVERTSSEFLLSAYGRGSGASADGIPGVAWAAKCQDCHMRDTTGTACNKADAPTYQDLALHDLTGGNAWISGILASVDQRYTVGYDPYNYAILSGGKYLGATIDVAGLQNHGANLARGRDRALAQLKMAATLEEVTHTADQVVLRVRNNTGHKLISGFPEGRRMFLNVKFYDADGNEMPAYEINPYEPLVISRGANNQAIYVSGGTLASKTDELVWEAEMSSSLTKEQKSFHFALADDRYKDNRIPPKGFDIAKAAERKAEPVWKGASAPDYFTADEYAGGYDEVTIPLPAGAVGYKAALYYQTTSKEYIEFLRDEANGTASTLWLDPATGKTPSGEPRAYVVQTDPFFANLKGWGNAIWDLWLHNGGAAPVEMTVLNDTPQPPPALTVDPPTGVKVSYNTKAKTATVTWTPPVTGANGYQVYRSVTAGGPYTQIGTVTSGTTKSFTDNGPFAPGMYYYVVKAYKTDKTGMVYTSVNSNEASMRVR